MDLSTLLNKSVVQLTNEELADLLEDAAIMLEEENQETEWEFVTEAIRRLREMP